jgi:hypothetical protein
MHLDHRGHPLHSRGLAVALSLRHDGKLDAFGEIVDLRKRGFVPVSGKLQPAGIVHHMQVRAVVDPETATLESIEGAQPAVAFEASEATAGESCRDPISSLRTLAGASLDAEFSRKLANAYGGPRGCSHLLVLTHLLASTVRRALALERSREAASVERIAGDRVFRRDLIVDGADAGKRTLQLAVQLTDLQFAPVRGIVEPMQHFASQFELRVRADIDLRNVRLTSIDAAERGRTLEDLETAPWTDRTADVAWLVGTPLMSGIGGKLIRAHGERSVDAPLLDVLLNLTPGMHQAMAVMDEGWALTAKAVPTVMGMGGIPDSCYMWRAGGALDRLRNARAKVKAD